MEDVYLTPDSEVHTSKYSQIIYFFFVLIDLYDISRYLPLCQQQKKRLLLS